MEPESLLELGDHPATDFLNTTVTGVIELLPDGARYLWWLQAAGLIKERQRERLQLRFSTEELDAAAHAARELREQLRPAVQAWAAGASALPHTLLLESVNRVLDTSGHRSQVIRNGDRLAIEDQWIWTTWRALLAPVAEAIADLFVTGAHTLVRSCEGPECPMWFYDRTKGHRRRWCSMATCGNRAKVRGYRARRA